MGALDSIAAFFGYARPRPQRATSGYAGADISRLTASLAQEAQFINTTLRYQLRALRARSRQLAQNNPFGRRFAQMVVDNVCGPVPFRLQAKVKFRNGKLDTTANRRIEDEWRGWGRKGSCELSGRFSWNALQRLLVRNLAVDGELLLRRYRGEQHGRHGFRIQIIDVDRLDDLKNQSIKDGGAIHMGVEVDAQSRPVAYHILKRKPSQWNMGYTARESDRVPAEDILHVFMPDFAEQVRGVPWMYAALLNLVHLGAYEEAAVIAARIGASKVGILKRTGDPTSADGLKLMADSQDPQGQLRMNAEPGEFMEIPLGYDFDRFDPDYPHEGFGPFIKACLRGISAGIGVAYHNLSGDMEGVTYSSARIAELDERDSWMTVQNFIAEHLHDDLYTDWLRTATLTGALPFNPANLDLYREVYWQGRRWAWVDPEKEVNASVKAIDARLKSRTRIIAEQGEDIEDTFDEIASEEQLAADKKVTLPPAGGEAAKPTKPAADENADAAAKEIKEIAADVRELKGRPTAQPLVVTNNMPVTNNIPEPKVIMQPPAQVTVEPANVEVNVDGAKVDVHVPEQRQGEVHVHVEPTPIQVDVNTPDELRITAMPTRESVSKTERDGTGQITTVKQTEKDAA